MRLPLISRPVLFLLVLLLVLPSSVFADFKKTKIAVLDFQMHGDQNTSKDMGKIVAEWLITGLVETGRFDVIERRLLEKILEEQKLGATGAIDTNSAAQLGKILGVKTIVAGTVTSLEGTNEINARLINVDTASIVSAERIRAGSAQQLRDLVSKISEKIAAAFPLEGYIVQRNDKKITIDLGKSMGVKPGMKFVAYKEGKVIKHPKTGEVLDVETVEIGIIEARDIRDKTSNGTVVQELTPNGIVYGTMVRSTALESLPEAEPDIAPVNQNAQERKGFIPVPNFMRRKQ